MPDLELRKAALEASGLTVEMWPCYHGGDWYPYRDLRCAFDALSKAEKATWEDKLCVVDIREDNSSRYTYAAAVESDPGAFWPWFLAWCERTGTDFELRRCKEKNYFRFHLYACGYRDDPEAMNTEAPELCWAGCKAVIAAAKRKEQP